MKKIIILIFFAVAAVLPAAEKIEIVPGYVSTAIHVTGLQSKLEKEFSSQISYREAGKGDFLPAYELIFNPHLRAARGVVVNLQENQEYELKVTYSDNGKKSSFTRKFRTRNSDVPVAKTIVLNAKNWKKTLTLAHSGKPDGYIRYTAEPGFVLDASDAENAFTITGKYFILDGLTIRNAKHNGIEINGGSFIIIRNCDIGHYGRAGVFRHGKGGRYCEGDKVLNEDSGIKLVNCSDILIERCYIHDTNGHANNWFYSHPAGPKAVHANKAGAVTMRFNDFIGGDKHRFNDVVECTSNRSPEGGFYRDGEIYGNYIALSNDDGIELEGGGCNTRFFLNRVENTLCGISTGCCATGPGFVFNNLVSFPGDEFSFFNTGFKGSHSLFGTGSLRFFNNTCVGFNGGLQGGGRNANKSYLKLAALNNLILVQGSYCSPNNLFNVGRATVDYTLYHADKNSSIVQAVQKYGQDKHGINAQPQFVDAAHGIFQLKPGTPGSNAGCRIPNFMENKNIDIGAVQPGTVLPYRPWELVSDKSIIDFRTNYAPQKVTLTAAKETSFRIVKNTEFDFFDVQPSSGVVTPGKPLTLTVSILPEKFTQARINNGAFLIRSAEGFSRPVGIRVSSRHNKKLLAKDRAGAIYGKLVKEERGSVTYEFAVRKAAMYYFHALTAAPGKKAQISLNNGKAYNVNVTGWGMPPKQVMWRSIQPRIRKRAGFTLNKGVHRITVSGAGTKFKSAALAPKAETFMLAPEK